MSIDHECETSTKPRTLGSSIRDRGLKDAVQHTDQRRLNNSPLVLAPHHLCKLIRSGLSRSTMERAGIYTERDTGRLRVMLRGSSALAPGLILPGFDRHGKRNGYNVARMMPPHLFPDGRQAKYLTPTGLGNRAYFPPLPGVLAAVNAPREPLMITEGILKALAASQVGIPCIGLMGVWNWIVKQSDPRELIPDLAGINWQGRIVLIVFDYDTIRKPDVNYAAAELARVLTERGADVRILHLPPGPRDLNGKPMKQAIDDYIKRYGEAAFREWVEQQMVELPERSLEEWREEMMRARLDSLSQPGVYIDTSPTGAGKSYADSATLRLAQEDRPLTTHLTGPAAHLGRHRSPPRSLTLVPTHAHCDETVSAHQEAGLAAAAYPRLSQETCIRHDEAEAVMGRGLSFRAALCPDCPHRNGCLYHQQYEAAAATHHAVATHARGAMSLAELGRHRTILSLHEAPLDALRPSFVTDRSLLAVEFVARQAEHVARDAKDRGFYRHLAKVAKELDAWLNSGDGPAEVPLTTPARHEPSGLHRDLNEACLGLGTAPPPEAMRIALAATLGKLSFLAVAVDERPTAGGEVKLVRRLVGVAPTDLPDDAAVWLSDATAARSELETATGGPVRDMTPRGRLLACYPTLQIIPARDVTKRRKPETVLPLLRGLLNDLPHRRVGLLTHKELAEPVLEQPYQSRLARVAYFGSGMSRGSNAWIGEGGCDALIVLGTPRVGSEAVRLHLLRLGNRRAALLNREEAGWGRDYWSGVTESGKRVSVKTWHYADHDWHAAYCSLVCGELVQAVGRGRGILREGIPVYLVSTENLAPLDDDDGRNGYPIADRPFSPLTDVQARVLGTLRRDDGRWFLRKSSEIAEVVGFSRQRVHEVLTELEAAGRVRRIGTCSGWVATR